MDHILSLYNWIPATVVTGTVALLSLVFRDSIGAYFAGSIRSKFDRDLAELNSKLTTKQDELDALRNGVLSGFWSRREAMEKRRFEALQSLWEDVVALSVVRVFGTKSGVN